MTNYKSLLNIVLSVLRPFIKANFGNWGKWQHCAQGEYVTGMKVKSERFQGNALMSWIHVLSGGDMWKDDSGINAIRLKCSDGKELISAEGVEGEWSHWVNVEEGKKHGRMGTLVRNNFLSGRPKKMSKGPVDHTKK